MSSPVLRGVQGLLHGILVRSDGGQRPAEIPLERVRSVRQVHGDRIVDAVRGCEGEPADGLVVTAPGEWAAVRTADCAPVVLAAPGGAAVVHAGWRGALLGIAGRAARLLSRRLGRPPARLVAVLGPHIGPCCFEVGREVADPFAHAFGRGVLLDGPGGRPHVHLEEAVRMDLLRAGLSPEAIHGAGRCTRCDPTLPSFRRDGERAGRMLTVVGLERAAAASKVPDARRQRRGD